MNLFKGIAKIALSPLRGAKEIYEDLTDDEMSGSKTASILTGGLSSIVKGTAKGIKEGVEDIFEE